MPLFGRSPSGDLHAALDPEAALRRKLGRRLRWSAASPWVLLFGVIPLGVAFAAHARPQVLVRLGLIWLGLAWAPAFLRCPRCQRRLVLWRGRRAAGPAACYHCGLRPL